ncbi:hypothetical protein CGCSCA5_v011744 [Colletotrichum siamense]|nr:hypothetical protein CGCSCA5_v011744 [Colletotrichum siamense]
MDEGKLPDPWPLVTKGFLALSVVMWLVTAIPYAYDFLSHLVVKYFWEILMVFLLLHIIPSLAFFFVQVLNPVLRRLTPSLSCSPETAANIQQAAYNYSILAIIPLFQELLDGLFKIQKALVSGLVTITDHHTVLGKLCAFSIVIQDTFRALCGKKPVDILDESDRTYYKKRIDELTENYRDTRTERNQWKSRSEKWESNCKALEAKLDQQCDRNGVLVSLQTNERNEWDTREEALFAEIEELQEKVHNKVQSWKVQKTILDLERRVVEQQKQLEQCKPESKAIQTIKDQLQDKDNQIKALEKQIEDRLKLHEWNTKLIANYEGEVRGLQDKLRDEAKRLGLKASEHWSEAEMWKKSHDKQAKKVESLKNEVEKLEGMVGKDQKAENDNMAASNRLLRETNKNLRNIIKLLNIPAELLDVIHKPETPNKVQATLAKRTEDEYTRRMKLEKDLLQDQLRVDREEFEKEKNEMRVEHDDWHKDKAITEKDLFDKLQAVDEQKNALAARENNAQQTIAAKDAEINRLKERAAYDDSKVAKIRSSYDKKSLELATKNQELEELKKARTNVGTDINQQVQRLSAALSQEKQKNSKLGNDLTQDREAIETEKRQVQQDRGAIENEKRQVQQDREKLEKATASAEQDFNNKKQEIAQREQEVLQKQAEVQAQADQLGKSAIQNQSLADVEGREQQLAQWAQTLHQQEAQNTADHQQITQHQQEITQKQHEITQQQQAILQERQAMAEQVQQQVQQQVEQLVQQQMQQLEEELEERQQALAIEREEFDKERERLRKGYQAADDKLNEEKRQLQNGGHDSSEMNKKMAEMIKSHTTQYEEMERLLHAKTMKEANFMKERKKLEGDMARTQRDCDRLRAENRHLRGKTAGDAASKTGSSSSNTGQNPSQPANNWAVPATIALPGPATPNASSSNTTAQDHSEPAKNWIVPANNAIQGPVAATPGGEAATAQASSARKSSFGSLFGSSPAQGPAPSPAPDATGDVSMENAEPQNETMADLFGEEFEKEVDRELDAMKGEEEQKKWKKMIETETLRREEACKKMLQSSAFTLNVPINTSAGQATAETQPTSFFQNLAPPPDRKIAQHRGQTPAKQQTEETQPNPLFAAFPERKIAKPRRRITQEPAPPPPTPPTPKFGNKKVRHPRHAQKAPKKLPNGEAPKGPS